MFSVTWPLGWTSAKGWIYPRIRWIHSRIGWIGPILQIVLVHAKQPAWQGIESILSPKQQRRPLPAVLYLSFFYAVRFLPWARAFSPRSVFWATTSTTRLPMFWRTLSWSETTCPACCNYDFINVLIIRDDVTINNIMFWRTFSWSETACPACCNYDIILVIREDATINNIMFWRTLS